MTVPSDPITPGSSFQPPAARMRPGTVTTAGYLLIGIALLSLVGLITALASYPTIRDVYAEVYKGTPMEQSSGAVAIATLAVSIISVLLFGVGTAVLAPFVLKGKQPARIIAWVLCGLVICCQGGSLASSGVNSASFGQSRTANGVDVQQLQKQLIESLPGWVRPVELASGGVLVVLAIAVVILLALPASHPFFRKQPEQWAPPAYPTV
jgi:hypothetical protein